MKKAYLVDFNVTTRVEVDVPEDFDPNNCNLIIPEHDQAFSSIVKEAVDNILEVPHNYLYEENAEIREDTECPYGTFGTEE